MPRQLPPRSCQIPPNLSPAYTDLSSPLSKIGLASEQRKVRDGTQPNFQFRRLLVRLEGGQGQTHTRVLADPTDKNKGTHIQSSMPGPEINVPHRVTVCHRETSTLGPFTHETHTVAPQKQLEGPRDNGKGHSHPKVTPSTSEMVAGGKQCYHRLTITPTKTCSADVYRCIKRRVGRSLKRAHGKWKLVTSGKQTAHKLPSVKGGLSGPKRVPVPFCKQHGPHSYRQHYSGCLHKQKGWDGVGPFMHPTMENTDLVYQERCDSQSSTHPRPSECDSRQTIQTRPNHSNRMVSQHSSFSSNMQLVAPTQSGPLFHQVQHKASTVCLPCSRPPGMGSRCSQPVLGGAGSLCLPTSSHLGQSDGQVTGLPVQQNDTDCTGQAQHVLVLGPGSHVQSDPPVSSQSA